MRRPFAGLRSRILAIVIVAFLPVFLLQFLFSLERRKDAVDAARGEAFRLSENMATEYFRRLDDTRRMLMFLSSTPEVKGKKWEESTSLFKEFLANTHNLVNIIVIDAEGYVLASAVPYQGPLNLSDRSFFQRAVRGKEFSIGDYTIGRITGKPLLPLALPVLDERKEVDFLVVASWDLGWLGDIAASFPLPEGSVLMLADEKGTVLMRYPEGEGYVGTTVPEAPVMKAMLEGPGSGSVSVEGLDGVRRLYVHRSITPGEEAGKVYICAGFPEGMIYGPANRALVMNLAILSIIAAVVILLAYALGGMFILKPIQNLRWAAGELERGNLSVRAGRSGAVGEIGLLAESFNRMAVALQERAEERDRTLERVERLGLLYAVLSEVNRAIARFQEKEPLLQEVCNILVDRGLFRMVWVGQFDRSSSAVEPVAVAGDSTGYVGKVSVRADDSPLGLGPTGRAVVEGTPQVCYDVVADARMEPWRERLLEAGLRSSGAFPLLCEGKVVGAINVYSELPGYFGPEEMEIMERLAADISFALEAMEREKRRREAEERIGLINHCLLNLETDPMRNMERITAASREVLDCAVAHYWRRAGDSYRLAFFHGVVDDYKPSVVEMSREDLENAVLWWRGSLAGEEERLRRLQEALPEVNAYGWRSMLSHPVVLGTDFVGCLCLFDRKEREFRDEEVDYAGMLARALAVEEERWRREEGLRDLMDIASHELRHPITVMKGYSLTLSRFTDRLSEEEKWDILRRIDQGADRLTFILEEMMDLIRIEREVFTVSVSEVPARDLALAAMEEIRKRYEQRAFRLIIGEDAGRVVADPEKLPFALMALLDNAAKFSPPGEEVVLEVRRKEGEVIFSVLDRGPGVPPGEEAGIFERFTHVGEVRYHSVPGMGLGLYIARAIVSAHEGRIWYRPREGGGSVFTIAIPAG